MQDLPLLSLDCICTLGQCVISDVEKFGCCETS